MRGEEKRERVGVGSGKDTQRELENFIIQGFLLRLSQNLFNNLSLLNY